MPKVNLPDGRVINFPYDMSPADIESALGEIVSPEYQPIPAPITGDFEERPGTGESMARAVAQGGTFGLGDELAAGIGAAGNTLRAGDDEFGKRYDRYLQGERRKLGEFREDSPVAAYGAEIAGSLPTALLAGGRLAQALALQRAPLAGRVAGSAGIGATEGGVYGFNAGEGGVGPRLEEGAYGAGLGGTVAAAAPAAAVGARSLASNLAKGQAQRQAVKTAPSTAKLKESARAAYQRADDAGVQIAPDSFGREVADMQTRLAKEGIDPTLHPKASAILSRFQQAAESNEGAPQITTLRRLASSVAGSTDPDERRIGSMMVEMLDDYTARLGPDDVLSGDPSRLSSDLLEARDTYRRAKGSEMMDEVFTKADLQASGVENGLRIQFRQILNNPKMRRMLSSEEVEAMERVVKGTPVSNVMKKLSRLGFGSGQQSNVMSGMMGSGLGGAAGAAAGGPAGAAVGAAIPPAIGYGASRAAEAIATKNARLAQALLAQGGLPEVPVNQALPRLARMLVERNAPITAPAREQIYQYR